MMKNSPYLDQDRDLDILLRLVRDYDAQVKKPRNPSMPARTGATMRAGKHMISAVTGPTPVVPGKSPLKRAS
ncbi:MAG: hypothetical protein RIC16_13490 [Rhodospirillales bacterium]